MIEELDHFELHKHAGDNHTVKAIHNTPIINYGRIVKVIDITTVVVELIVQVSIAKEYFTVTLLSFTSDHAEVSVEPQIGDRVLLLFLQYYDPYMFIEDSVVREDVIGYCRFSGVGVLMSTITGLAGTITSYFKSGDDYRADLRSFAQWTATFNTDLALTFCRAVENSEDEAMIELAFGEGRPFISRFLSQVTREHGFMEDNEGNLLPVDASVTERYSPYAPIIKEIQSSQTYQIGNGENDAPVSITVAEKAPISIAVAEESSITVTSESDIVVATETNMALNGNTIKLNGEGKSLVTWEDLNTALQSLLLSLQTHTHAVAGGGGGSATPSTDLAAVTLDLSGAKTSSIKTDG